jgi:phosphosulfolactate synthase (CoM biosynthesis protein A)
MAMSSEESAPQSSEDYFKQLEKFTEEQQKKVAKVIDDGAKVMADFKPFSMAKDINTQVDDLVTKVNDELEKSMKKVSDQMKQINEKTGLSSK